MRINKLLSNYGYCSRKDVRKLIDDERIVINGKLATQGQWVEFDDEILLDGTEVEKKEDIYLVFNKPVGIICTADEKKENNIIKYINFKDYIFPVGRLDKDSQGLIILTNDGELANKILEAENGHEKEYIVEVDREINEDFIYRMSNGLEIDGQITKKCYVEKLDNSTFKIILTQGLNRQIRKMCLKVGYKVQKLERVRILNIEIKDLGYGELRNITKAELEKLKQMIK
ncbi:MAG: pseudouridine synthase [Sarcina sp.]